MNEVGRAKCISRRNFLKTTAVAGGGLFVGVYVTACNENISETAEPFYPSAFFSIHSNNLIHVTIPRTEMGQGVMTALPMLIVEELDANMENIRVSHAIADENKYGPQGTVASVSIHQAWIPFRKAGAAARLMLVAAASELWGVPSTECTTEKGFVVHGSSGRRAPYGELAERASQVALPKQITLKAADSFRIIGRELPRLDTLSKVNGTANYGIDVSAPDMLVASILRCPMEDGRVQHFDDRQALQQPEIEHIISIERRVFEVGTRNVAVRSGVAVVANNYWAAMKGRKAMSVTWDTPGSALQTSDKIWATLKQAAKDPQQTLRDRGDVTEAARESVKTASAEYEVPYLAHACMEPMNCTVELTSEHCSIWAPTQSQTLAHRLAVKLTGLQPEAVTVHTPYLGGGFGRRTDVDYVAEAILLAQAVNRPVKVIWSREDDLQTGYFRPAFTHRLSGHLDEENRILGWEHRLAGGSSITGRLFNDVAEDEIDWTAVLGAQDIPYAAPNYYAACELIETGIPTGYMRGIAHAYTNFANECFVDELALAAAQDPLEFRLEHLRHSPRAQSVLRRAAQEAGWGRPLPAGRFHGIALFQEVRGTEEQPYALYVAQVAEVSIQESKLIKVHRVVCAADFGRIVNAEILRAQMEGGILFGLNSTLKSEITIRNGRVQQTNFDNYPLLRLSEAPNVEVHLIDNDNYPAGSGEKGVPAIAPAVANAIYAATGVRLRRLPLHLDVVA